MNEFYFKVLVSSGDLDVYENRQHITTLHHSQEQLFFATLLIGDWHLFRRYPSLNFPNANITSLDDKRINSCINEYFENPQDKILFGPINQSPISSKDPLLASLEKDSIFYTELKTKKPLFQVHKNNIENTITQLLKAYKTDLERYKFVLEDLGLVYQMFIDRTKHL